MDTEDIGTKYQNEWKKVFHEVMDKYVELLCNDVNQPFSLKVFANEDCQKELIERLNEVQNFYNLEPIFRYEEVEEDND
jgi:hypothetical protein